MVEYKAYTGLLEGSTVELIGHLCQEIFGYFDRADFCARIKIHQPQLTLIAFEHEIEAVAFKVGYTINKEKFFSWLGGVQEEYRQQGIGTVLMKLQHGWCIRNGFQMIETHTNSKWKQMIALNLKSGLRDAGTFYDKRGREKIIFQRFF